MAVSKQKGPGSRNSCPKPADPGPSTLARPRLVVGPQGQEVPHTQHLSPVTAQPFPKTTSSPTPRQSEAQLCSARHEPHAVPNSTPQAQLCPKSLEPRAAAKRVPLFPTPSPSRSFNGRINNFRVPGKSSWRLLGKVPLHCPGLVPRNSWLHPQPHKRLLVASDLTAARSNY